MKTWFIKGKQRIVPTFGKHLSVKLLGVLNYETGEILVQESQTFDAQVFMDFLKAILEHYPEGKIVLVLDNARIHHAKLLQPFLAANPRLQLVFLPPYSPNLNPIEGLWKWLKDTCINNVFYSKYYDIVLAVRKFVDWVNTIPEVTIDRLCI
jgi:Transposase and inactivated derivatives